MSSQWSKDSENIFERFAAGIDDAISNGEELSCVDSDLKYGIDLQHKRLKRLGLKMKCDITPRGMWTDGYSSPSGWTDEHYEIHYEVRTCKKTESFYKDGACLFRKTDHYDLRQTVTDFRSGQDVSGLEYICPSCGAISKVGQLIEGCPFCGTKFKTSELYPKISSFDFTLDTGYKSGRLEKLAFKIIPICIGAIHAPFLLGGLFMLNSERHGNPWGIIFAGLIVALIFGFSFGYCIAYWIDKFKDENRSRNRPMAKYQGAAEAFERYMKTISPEFSYQFFAGKAVSLIKMLLYSDAPSELPFYNAQSLDPSFLNIVNVSSLGAVGITRIENVGNYVVVNADVYLENTYYDGSRIRQANDIVRVVMKKNITKPVNPGFSITSLHCPMCGGSYDATKNKTCPVCGAVNRFEDVDWSVESLTR